MKPLKILDDFTEEETFILRADDDKEYPINLWMTDGFGKSDLSFTKAEAEAMRDWLVSYFSPLENK